MRLADGRRLRGRISPNLLFLYRKTVNISRNLAVSGRSKREKKLGVQKASGGAKLAIRGTKLTFGVGKKFGSTEAPGEAKSL